MIFIITQIIANTASSLSRSFTFVHSAKVIARKRGRCANFLKRSLFFFNLIRDLFFGLFLFWPQAKREEPKEKSDPIFCAQRPSLLRDLFWFLSFGRRPKEKKRKRERAQKRKDKNEYFFL